MNIDAGDLADEIQSLCCAYDALSNLAGEASCCNSEDVANVMHILNARFEQLAKQSVDIAFNKQS